MTWNEPLSGVAKGFPSLATSSLGEEKANWNGPEMDASRTRAGRPAWVSVSWLAWNVGPISMGSTVESFVDVNDGPRNQISSVGWLRSWKAVGATVNRAVAGRLSSTASAAACEASDPVSWPVPLAEKSAWRGAEATADRKSTRLN